MGKLDELTFCEEQHEMRTNKNTNDDRTIQERLADFC